MQPKGHIIASPDDETPRSNMISEDVSRGSTPTPENHNTSAEDRPWSVLPESKIRWLLIVASFAAATSPLSTSTYYPSVTAIAKDLDVSVSKINLTISTYQIFQGLSPTVTAAFADIYGRRPAFLACFGIYFIANLGLALQKDFTALLILRCVQSAGSSGTFALAQAVTADVATRADRGKYLTYAMTISALGPVVGPVLGGLLTYYLGWRAVFWTLLSVGTVLSIVIFVFFCETARSVVGDGSIAPPPWNRSLLQLWNTSHDHECHKPNLDTLERSEKRPNPLTSLTLLLDRENFILCVSGGLIYAGFASVTSVLASQVQQSFGFTAIQAGLCYLPVGLGSLLSYRTVVRLIDWNFRREAKKQGLHIVKGHQPDISHFNLEKARLEFLLPIIIASAGLQSAYGWQMQYYMPLAPTLITMFLIALLVTGVMVSNAALLTDLNRENAAAIGAAMNLTRLLLSAGAVAVIGPLNNSVGIGWTATFTAGVWLLLLVPLGLLCRDGFSWRAGRNQTVGSSHAELASLVRSSE